MPKIVWDQTGERFYEWGIDRVVFYPKDSNGNYQPGVAWNGVIKISESPSGFQYQAFYLDSRKYLTVAVTEEYSATIEATSSPKEFLDCNGSNEVLSGIILGQQIHNEFGLCYRTFVGNDVDGLYHGYKLHLIYGAVASVPKKDYKTVSSSPDILVLSWAITTRGIKLEGYDPVASLTLDSRKINSLIFSRLESVLYGSDGPPPSDPRLPLPLEVITSSYPLFTVGVTAIGKSQIDPFN